MYITCPSCSTSYEVDGTNIGHQGRAVRCFNCQHTWHQYPVPAQPPMRPVQTAAYASPRYVPQSAQGYQPQPYGEPAYAGAAPARAYAPPQPAYAMPQPAPVFAPMPEPEPEPAPPPPRPAPVRAAPPPPPAPKPAPAPAPKPVEPMPSDKELDAMLGPIKEDAAARAFGGPSRDDTTALDEDAISKLPDPEPVDKVSHVDDDFDDDIEPEDIPDPDPIPGVFVEDDDIGDMDKGSGLKRLIAPAIIIVAIGAIIAGLIVGRAYVVALWPAANDYVYDLIGLHVAVPGDGLERKITRTAVETVANVDHVIATGFVTNVSDKEQPIPEVLVQLLDAKVQVLDTKTVKLEKTSLQPGETLQFKAVFEGAPATARTVRVEWGKFIEAAAP